jgi:adenylate cyclase
MTADTHESTRWPELHRVRRAIVVVDVVESVRLMQQHEDDVIDRWRRFVHEVRTEVLPAHGGRMVKSLGDGMLLEFASAPHALAATFAIQHGVDRHNVGRRDNQAIRLRAGVHVAEVVVDEFDVFGSGVNLAARLAALAAPGEVIVSPEVRDQCLDGHDAGFVDLGDVYIKHIVEPVHAMRAAQPGTPALAAGPAARGLVEDLSPTAPAVAVMPFVAGADSSGLQVLGELVADGVVARLAASTALRVISRLSSSALAPRQLATHAIGALLGCDYVLSGRCAESSGRVWLHAEMAEARTGAVLWSDRLQTTSDELLQPDDPVTRELARRAAEAIVEHELRQVMVNPLPTLRSFSLQLAGIGLMHRSPRREFDQAGQVLDHLVDRHPRVPVPRALLAQWHVLRVTRGLTGDVQAEARHALEHTRRALQADPENALALAVEGFVHCHMLRDLDAAQQRIDAALSARPSEPLAWLFQCVVQGFRGDGEAAWSSAQRAIALSPLDPMRPYVDGLAASAALAAGLLEPAVELAERSLRANRNHVPTLRALMIARVERDELPQARELARRVLEQEPDFTVSGYLARAPRGSGQATRERYARALSQAGIPN